MKICKFTEPGSFKFQDLMMRRPIGFSDQSNLFKEVSDLISDPTYTIPLNLEFELRPFTKRHELGEYLWRNLSVEGELSSKDLGDTNFWNWLSAAWLKTLVEVDDSSSTEASIQDFKHWIMVENVRRGHWHFVSHPFLTLQANSGNLEDSMAFLSTPILHPGDLVDKIGSNRRFLKPPISTLTTLMYYDSESGVLRKGITSRPGEVNQLSRYLNQIDQTIDFEEMTPRELLLILPSNFKEWVDYAMYEIEKRGDVS